MAHNRPSTISSSGMAVVVGACGNGHAVFEISLISESHACCQYWTEACRQDLKLVSAYVSRYVCTRNDVVLGKVNTRLMHLQIMDNVALLLLPPPLCDNQQQSDTWHRWQQWWYGTSAGVTMLGGRVVVVGRLDVLCVNK